MRFARADAQCIKDRLHALKLDGDAVVIACTLQLIHALLDRYIAVADNSAAQVLATAGTEAAFARIGIRERLYDEVLCMDIVRIRRNSCKCGSRVLICAEEVAHIGEEAEVLLSTAA